MKKRTALLFSFFVVSAGLAAAAQPYLRIIQPYENANVPNVSQSFVFGSVLPATATLTINGIPVKPHSNGGFLAMVPFQEGKFRIEAFASDGVSTTTVVRFVNVAGAAQSYPTEYGKIDATLPKVKSVVRPGDRLDLAFQAAPGGQASFHLEGTSENFPLLEQPGKVQGIYKGVYVFRPDDKLDGDDVVYNLKRKDGKKITGKAGFSITMQRRRVPRIVELKEDSVLYTGPDSDYGYSYFCGPGTRLEVTGEWGDYLRVAIGDSNQAWIKRASSVEMPSGTLPARSLSRNLRINPTADNSTVVEIPLQFRHPHRIEQTVNPHVLKLTLYGVVADSDRMRYRSNDSIVKEVVWSQPEPTTAVFEIFTDQENAWGYDVRYDGNTMLVEIRHKPVLIPTKALPLRGLKVALDAGHSKDSFGTIGPWGNTEASVNLTAAKATKERLEERGATVVMIQDGTKELSLSERLITAWQSRANIYISLHADACADGQDPRELEGFSVHYYHPQSRALAETVHRIYGKKQWMRDQGLWRSNLAVCRITQMPSILFEQGFLILPEFEEKMMTPQHQQVVADTITSTIVELIRKEDR